MKYLMLFIVLMIVFDMINPFRFSTGFEGLLLYAMIGISIFWGNKIVKRKV